MKLSPFILTAIALAQVPHQHHPPASDEYAKVLEDPSRDEWQKPHDVVMALDLKPSDVIADIGAGTGYFARRFARHAGKVYAVDIDEKLLAIAAKDAPPNLTTVLAAPDDPRLPERSIDIVFFCDVLHHIENRAAYYPKLAKALKPGGRIVVVDFYKKPLPVGPPPAMKLSDEQVIAELRDAGFVLVKRLDILPYQYYLVFEKRPASATARPADPVSVTPAPPPAIPWN
jgi:SAM-dependent methyltransferase